MILSVPERRALAEAWVAARAATGVQVMNHIGANSIVEAKEMAAHSQAIGCDAIAAMPPFFFKAAGVRGLALWLKEVGAAAPALPLYYYHFPAITGVAVEPHALLAAIEEVGVPTFRGMKFTEFNLWHYSNCVRHGGGRYDMCYGRDEAMLGGLATGAKASIGNGFNFMAGTYQRLRKAWFAGDVETARLEQARACAIVDLMNDPAFGGAGLPVSRVIYELKGKVKLGPPRAPLVALTAAQVDGVKAALYKMDFFAWCD
jgi:N-acetylneuraminate lyase